MVQIEIMVQIGDIIKIISMKGEPQYNGREGVVTSIDDIGQLHGTWGGCAVIPGIDYFEVIEAKKPKEVVLKLKRTSWLL